MKSNSTGRSMARARSDMNMKAPLSTPTSRGARPGVVRRDLLAELRRRACSVLLRRPPSAAVSAARDGSHRVRGGDRRASALRRAGHASEPSPTSVALTSPCATARTRSTAAGVGGCPSPPSAEPRRTAGEPEAASRRPARRASVGSMAAAQPSSRSTCHRAAGLPAASAAATSRSAMSSSSGSSSWRTGCGGTRDRR